jgi:starch phosphorylase
MDQEILNMQAERLASKIKHYLITMMGVTVDEAYEEEVYRALCMTLREEIMINWTATFHTHALLPLHGIHAGQNARQ